ncbi:MAG: helix-turn-helix transcriptional regulator [Planctomycetota bacterium]
MPELSLDQWMQVHQATQQVARVADVQDFHRHVVDSVKLLMSHTLISSEFHDLSVMQILSSHQTRDDEYFQAMMPVFAEYLHEHPCVKSALETRSLNVMGVLDKMSPADFEGLGLYNEFYRHVDIRDQIIIARSQGHPNLLALAVSRDERFTPEERRMLELFAPSLSDAHETWQALQRAEGQHAWALGALEHLHCAALYVNAEGRVLDRNSLATKLLAAYWPMRDLGDRLPQGLLAWIKASQTDPAHRQHPYVRENSNGVLTFRLAEDPKGNGWLILGRETPAVADLTPLLDLGLTEKQAEVLLAASEGLTYGQIALKLGKAVGTVRKQMEQLMDKLEVHDKAAAVAKATHAMNNPGLSIDAA